MVARLTQLISRYVSKALLFVAGLLYANEDQAAELASYGPEVAALVSAILLSVLDLVIHKLKTGGVMVPPGEKKDGGAIGSGGPGVAVLLLMLGLVAVLRRAAWRARMRSRLRASGRSSCMTRSSVIGVLTSGGKLDVGSAVVVEAVTELVASEALQPADAEAIAGLARRYGTLTAADVATARAVGATRSTYEATLATAKTTHDAAVGVFYAGAEVEVVTEAVEEVEGRGESGWVMDAGDGWVK